MPLAQLTFLPISFISGVWYPLDGAPGWVTTAADIFPLKHIVDAFTGCFLAGTPDAGFAWGDLGVVAAWGVAGLVVATRGRLPHHPYPAPLMWSAPQSSPKMFSPTESSACWASMLSCVSSPVKSRMPIAISTTPETAVTIR